MCEGFSTGTTCSEALEFDLPSLEELLARIKEIGEGPAAPIKIQTLDLLPETDGEGHPFILDGTVFRKWGILSIWGDWLMHPNTWKRLREAIG